jgi:ribosomal protein L7/L12
MNIQFSAVTEEKSEEQILRYHAQIPNVEKIMRECGISDCHDNIAIKYAIISALQNCQKIKLIKIIRDQNRIGFGLKEAKNYVCDILKL